MNCNSTQNESHTPHEHIPPHTYTTHTHYTLVLYG